MTTSLDKRYPYTYACDYLRQTLKIDSRREASTKLAKLSDVLGVEKHKYACQLADEWLASKREALNASLTDEQILEVAEPFGAFEFGDAQGHKRIEFARAILEAAVNK